MAAQTREQPTGTRRPHNVTNTMAEQANGERTETRSRHEVHMPPPVINLMTAQINRELTGKKRPNGSQYSLLRESSESSTSSGSGISVQSSGSVSSKRPDSYATFRLPDNVCISGTNGRRPPATRERPKRRHQTSTNEDCQTEGSKYSLLRESSESSTSSGSGISIQSSGSVSSKRPDSKCTQPDNVCISETNGSRPPATKQRPDLWHQTSTNEDGQTEGSEYSMLGESSTSAGTGISVISNGLVSTKRPNPHVTYRPPDNVCISGTNGRRPSVTRERPDLLHQTSTNEDCQTGGSKRHCDLPWTYKILVPIFSCFAIAAVIALTVLLYTKDDYNEPYTEECLHDVAHFGKESTATCIYQYSTISEVDIITLKTKHGDIDFPNLLKNKSLENGTRSNATEITFEDWTLKFHKKNKKTVELLFVTNITDCKMMGGYEVLLKKSDDETLTLPFVLDIADDYTPTISKINAYIDDGSVNPSVELDCKGVLYCKQYLFYKVNVNEGEQSLSHDEDMFCTLNKSKTGVVKASCWNKWTDSELLNEKNTILSCAPSVPSDVYNKDTSVQEVHHLHEIKDLCTNQLTAGFGDRRQYFCRKRLPATDLDKTVIEVEFLKNQVHILNSTIPTDGTSQNTSKGRYGLHGHFEGNLLVLNITFNEVYHCDGGVYIVRITNANASDIRFELNLPAFESNSCKTDIKFPWQQEKKSTCQFCSEKDVSLYYVTDGSQTDVLPSEEVDITKQFIHGLVTLDLHVTNMSCNTSFLIHVSGEVNRTIFLITEGPFFGNIEKTFSNEIGINHTMFFRHFMGCFAKITHSLVTGQAVVYYTENITYSPHRGWILDHFITYQTRDVFHGSLVYSVVTYIERNMKVKSEDHFVVIHIPDAFCAQKKEGCNYKHPSFNDRFVSCPNNVSLPVEQHCVEGTIWRDPDGDCLGRCE